MKILLLILLIPLYAIQILAQNVDEGRFIAPGDTIEVSERDLNEALQEIAREVQINELQRMVAEMAIHQQTVVPDAGLRYEERFERLERLLFGMARRLGYTPSETDRRNLIVMPDGSTAMPYSVYPVTDDDPILMRQISLLQEQIVLLEQQMSDGSEGEESEEVAADNIALRLQAMRSEMQRLQQERTAKAELLVVENHRADSLFRSFLTEEPLSTGVDPAKVIRTTDSEFKESAGNIEDTESLRGTLISLYRRQLFFTVASYDLTSESESTLEEVVALLQKHPELKVLLTGYASPEGNRDYNLQLSRRRAESAASYLQRKGIANDRIQVNPEGVDKISDMKTYGRRVNVRVF